MSEQFFSTDIFVHFTFVEVLEVVPVDDKIPKEFQTRSFS
jgi:hypothetical protein